MYPDMTADDIREMIIDRVILLSESHQDDIISDEIIGMLTALYDRTVMDTDKTRDVEYTTSIGTIVREKEYASGNSAITLSSYVKNKPKTQNTEIS